MWGNFSFDPGSFLKKLIPFWSYSFTKEGFNLYVFLPGTFLMVKSLFSGITWCATSFSLTKNFSAKKAARPLLLLLPAIPASLTLHKSSKRKSVNWLFLMKDWGKWLRISRRKSFLALLMVRHEDVYCVVYLHYCLGGNFFILCREREPIHKERLPRLR